MTSLQIRAQAELELRRRRKERRQGIVNQICSNTPGWAIPLLSPKRYKAAYGGRSGGKSHFFAEQIVKRCIEDPNLRVVCIREIQKSLKFSAKALIERKIEEFGATEYFDVLTTEIRSKNGTGLIIFQGMQDHTADSIKSLEGFGIAWVEEAQNFSARSLELLRPTIRAKGSEIWFSWNPENSEDAVDSFFRGNIQPQESAIVQVNYYDNPHLPEESKLELAIDKERDTDYFNHVWLGQYNKQSKLQIFAGKWRVDDFVVGQNWDGPYYGADWGFGVDPTCAVEAWIYNDHIFINRESWALQLELDRTAKRWKEDIPGIEKYTVRADSARPDSISHVRQNGGGVRDCIPRLVGAVKGPNSVKDGIEFIRSFKAIVVHERCKHFQDEMKMYRYKTNAAGDPLPEPLDKNNHCLTAGTLITTDKGEKPIESVSIGDRVLTRAGYKQVVWSGQSGVNREVFTVTTKNGKQFEATANHEVLTHRGFVRVDTLRYGDKVLTLNHCLEWQEDPHLKLIELNTTDSFIPDILTQSKERTGFTMDLPKLNLRENSVSCIDRYGKIITVKSLLAIISITKMVIHLITARQILNVFTEQSIYQNTTSSGVLKIEKNELPILISFVRWLRLGTLHQKKGKSFIKNWLEILAKKIDLMSQKNAISVVRPIPLTTLPHSVVDSVLIPASLNGDENRELMTSKLFALFVESLSKETNTQKFQLAVDHVQTVSATRIADKVYDLTVEEQHEFFANGVLVHNCVDSLRYSIEPLIKRRSSNWSASGVNYG